MTITKAQKNKIYDLWNSGMSAIKIVNYFQNDGYSISADAVTYHIRNAPEGIITRKKSKYNKSNITTSRPVEFDNNLVSHISWLGKIANKYSYNPTEKQDIVSDTIELALRYANTFNGGSFKGWLRQVMRGAVYSKNVRSLPFTKTNDILEFIPIHATQEGDLIASQIMDMVNNGPYPEVMLHIASGDNTEETALNVGTTRQRVHQKVKRAREYYRKHLGMNDA